MQKRQLIPRFPLFQGRIASVCLVALFAILFSVTAHAQTGEDGLPDKRDYNKDVRTTTWSIFAQGGLSRAGGVWYGNIDAKDSYIYSPALGGGVDFTIRPWVRIGAEYKWSRYRREQRFSSVAPVMPVKTYGNYMMNHHNVALSADFNVMEFWPRRQAQWFNIWVGTGLGYMMADGNEYGIWFNNTITQNGVTTPITGNVNINNSSSVTVSGNLTTKNDHSAFDRFFIPTSVEAEFDVSRKFTIGLKAEMDWVLSRKEIAPKAIAYGLVTLRYNFVAGKAKKMKPYFNSQISSLNARINDIQRMADTYKARAEKAEADNKRMSDENANLQRRLKECEDSKANLVVQKPSHIVLFENNSSVITPNELQSLKSFASKYLGKRLSLVAEASTPGTERHNQNLSEARLKSVIKVLEELGFSINDLRPRVAIGSQNGISGAEGRRVTVTVEVVE